MAVALNRCWWTKSDMHNITLSHTRRPETPKSLVLGTVLEWFLNYNGSGVSKPCVLPNCSGAGIWQVILFANSLGFISVLTLWA